MSQASTLPPPSQEEQLLTLIARSATADEYYVITAGRKPSRDSQAFYI